MWGRDANGGYRLRQPLAMPYAEAGIRLESKRGAIARILAGQDCIRSLPRFSRAAVPRGAAVVAVDLPRWQHCRRSLGFATGTQEQMAKYRIGLPGVANAA